MEELVAIVAAKAGVSDTEARALLAAALDGIVDLLASVGRVELGGFGAFEVRKRRPRVGRNPRTGEKLVIPASLYPAFRAGPRLRKRVNQLPDVPSQ